RELLVRAPVHNPMMPAVVTDWVPAFKGARPVPDSAVAADRREHIAPEAPVRSAPAAPAAVAETVFVAPARLAAQRAAERAASVVDVRVLDRWGVPVAQPAYVTVSAQGAQPSGRDADPSSVGLQLLSTATGRLAIELRPGREVGPGALQLKSGDATVKVPLEL